MQRLEAGSEGDASHHGHLAYPAVDRVQSIATPKEQRFNLDRHSFHLTLQHPIPPVSQTCIHSSYNFNAGSNVVHDRNQFHLPILQYHISSSRHWRITHIVSRAIHFSSQANSSLINTQIRPYYSTEMEIEAETEAKILIQGKTADITTNERGSKHWVLWSYRDHGID